MCISEIKQTIYSLIFFFFFTKCWRKFNRIKLWDHAPRLESGGKRDDEAKENNKYNNHGSNFPPSFCFFWGPRNKWAENEKKEVNAAQISCIRARKLKVALFRAYLLTVFRDESAKVTSRKWSRLWEFWCYQNTKKILRFYSQNRFPTNCCWEIVLFLSPKKNLEAIQFIFIPE